MSLKPIICVGDRTSHGGQVITGAVATQVLGRLLARVGDKVSCPLHGHGGVTTIVTGDASMTDDGKAVARHGDKTACGATLIAGQMTVVVGGAGGASTARASAAAATASGLLKVSNPLMTADNLLTLETPAEVSDSPPTMAPAIDYGTPSGASWVSQFPTRNDTESLAQPFRAGVESFLASLRLAGANVVVSATLRPPERAFLMHWSWRIVNGTPPSAAATTPDLHIDWQHRDASGNANPLAAQAGAQAMVDGYGISGLQVPPALNSRHIQGNAIDMTISWAGSLSIANAAGQLIEITSTPRTGMNTQLAAVGLTYGVHKFIGGAADRPHWSSDGH